MLVGFWFLLLFLYHEPLSPVGVSLSLIFRISSPIFIMSFSILDLSLPAPHVDSNFSLSIEYNNTLSLRMLVISI